jgi:hypothetical protein
VLCKPAKVERERVQLNATCKTRRLHNESKRPLAKCAVGDDELQKERHLNTIRAGCASFAPVAHLPDAECERAMGVRGCVLRDKQTNPGRGPRIIFLFARVAAGN